MGANASIVEFMDILKLGWDVTTGAANELTSENGGHASVRIETEARNICRIGWHTQNRYPRAKRSELTTSTRQHQAKTCQIIAKQAPYVN